MGDVLVEGYLLTIAWWSGPGCQRGWYTLTGPKPGVHLNPAGYPVDFVDPAYVS